MMMMMMMVMKWCPLSRGYEKARLQKRRGELLTLADLDLEEGTNEERELRVRQLFTTLWTENQLLRSLHFILIPTVSCLSS